MRLLPPYEQSIFCGVVGHLGDRGMPQERELTGWPLPEYLRVGCDEMVGSQSDFGPLRLPLQASEPT